MRRIFPLFLIFLLIFSGCGGRVVMEYGDEKISATEFSYYYWSEFFYFREVYEEYTKETVDLSKPLDGQMYDDNTTWQEHMVEQTITMIEETKALAMAAKEADFVLPEEYEDAYDDVIVNFTDAAMAQEYKNVDAYLQASYGKGADKESFEAYLYDTHLASAYADELYAQADPTDEEVQAYYDAHMADYDENGMEQARQDLHTENYNNAILQIINEVTFTVHHDNIRITAPKGLYE
ncbi:MAG: hypothetical protein J6J43_07435 [Oscillospiraceae bacterium]|nr:hypothetical protein [Oscillospiraceae bacterium]